VRKVADKVDDVRSDLTVIKARAEMSSSAAAAKRIGLSDFKGLETPTARAVLGNGRTGTVFKAQ
jgi:hypothetical protein